MENKWAFNDCMQGRNNCRRAPYVVNSGTIHSKQIGNAPETPFITMCEKIILYVVVTLMRYDWRISNKIQ